MRFFKNGGKYFSALTLSLALVVGFSLNSAKATIVTVNGTGALGVDQLSGTFHTLNSATGGSILDLNVSVQFGGLSQWGDLDMFIVHNGISVQLLDFENPNDCCSGGDPFNVTFDDGAANILGQFGAVGSFKPQNGFLSAFIGQDLAGLWELQIFEEYSVIGETDLIAWSISADIDSAVSAVPLPAALPLYGAGLALMGFIGWRRKRGA